VGEGEEGGMSILIPKEGKEPTEERTDLPKRKVFANGGKSGSIRHLESRKEG